MRICIVARDISDNYMGSFEFDQAKALNDFGHEVFVISLDLRSVRRKRKWGVFFSEYRGIKIIRASLPIGPINEKILDWVAEWLFKCAFNRITKKYGSFDIIHAHFLSISYPVIKSLKSIPNYSVPIVVTEHSSTVNAQFFETEKRIMEKAMYVYKHADALIAVSEHLSKIIKMNYNIAAEVIYNTFDEELFKYDEKRRKADFNNGERIFVSTGNLTTNKRMDLLIECFCEAFRNKCNYKLYIFGDGPKKASIENLVKKCNKKGDIFLMGQKERSEIAEFYCNADAFVLLSEKETFGVAYIEAMASGLPVMACRSGGPEGFIKNRVGIIADGNREDIVNKLGLLDEMSLNCDSKYISDYAISICSAESIAKHLTSLYEKTLNYEVLI